MTDPVLLLSAVQGGGWQIGSWLQERFSWQDTDVIAGLTGPCLQLTEQELPTKYGSLWQDVSP